MKQTRRILSILLSLVLLLGTLSVGMSVFAAEKTTVRFGTYPQSEVTDIPLLGKLADVEKHWQSYNYYSGTGNMIDGKMKASDYMKYADFAYNGVAYRAVQFTKYRPSHTGALASETAGNGSGYATDYIYYFKFEPIEWVVLSQANGILMSKKLLDAQAYENVVSSGTKVTYAKSSIRTFLTTGFQNAAFSASQQSAMKAMSRNAAAYGVATGTTVTDKVSLLSYNEAIKGAGTFLAGSTACPFSTSANSDGSRVAKEYTDYAKCQGLSMSGTGFDWWLMTPSESAAKACSVDSIGALSHQSNANFTNKGVRPIICLPTPADNTESAIVNCRHTGAKTTFPAVAPTCKEPGHGQYVICNQCSAVVSGSGALIPATDHVDEKMLNGEKGADGWCDVCGEELTLHLDNSGKVQINGPLQNLFDLIRKLVAKIDEMLDRLKADKKTDKTTTTEPQPEQPAAADDETLNETGQALNSFGDLLGTLIGAFKGMADKQSTEKEENRTEFWNNFTGLFTDENP